MGELLLDVQNLTSGYQSKEGNIIAVNDVSFALKKGEFLGLAGESGCGKSTLAYTLLGLLPSNGRVFDGKIAYQGRDLVGLSERELRTIRWQEISMVFQSAMSALNPVLTIREQMLDTIFAHEPRMPLKVAESRIQELMKLVELPVERLDDYPHQLSGGMKQRVVIALALVLQPNLVLMDEPTTALDVVVQRSIIRKIEDLQNELDFSIIFITHDLSLLIEVSDKIAIMYSGQIVEIGPARQVYTTPHHPYTVGLMSSFPSLTGEFREFGGIPGKPPSLQNPPQGCRFHPRCPKA
ncbi:MAG: ABC transporter ATP-binding protein, partial [Firmicutes bacterium]|nr:ABC transporter ATP-binding protein [Bacillota bacterium]